MQGQWDFPFHPDLERQDELAVLRRFSLSPGEAAVEIQALLRHVGHSFLQLEQNRLGMV